MTIYMNTHLAHLKAEIEKKDQDDHVRGQLALIERLQNEIKADADAFEVVRDFMCSCGEERKKQCDDMLEEVKKELGASDGDLLTRIVISLNWDYNAGITQIANDQWSAITAESWFEAGDDGGDDEEGIPRRKRLHVYMQCDRLEHGLAAVWKAFADAHPDIEHTYKGT